MSEQRIFIGVFPAGIRYADRKRERHGDYAPLAFLSYATLDLRFERDCPKELCGEITAHAATIQARTGQLFEVSTSGQTVRLGPGAPDPTCHGERP